MYITCHIHMHHITSHVHYMSHTHASHYITCTLHVTYTCITLHHMYITCHIHMHHITSHVHHITSHYITLHHITSHAHYTDLCAFLAQPSDTAGPFVLLSTVCGAAVRLLDSLTDEELVDLFVSTLKTLFPDLVSCFLLGT